MNIQNSEVYNNQIYKAIVVNENFQNDPQGDGRVQIYIPSMQSEASTIYKQYMEVGNKEQSDYYSKFPWAVTLVKDLKNGNVVYGNFIDNNFSQFIILGLQANNPANENTNILGLDYNISGDTLTQYTTAIIIENEVGLGYRDFLNNNIADSYYTNIMCNDNGAFSVGLIQWHANNAFDILLKIKNELPNWETHWNDKDLYIYKDLNKGSAVNNNYNTYKLTINSSEYNSIKSMLGSDKGKEIQLKHASDFAYSYIKDLQDNYKISNPAVIIWLSDFMNRYGPNITNTKRKAYEICNNNSDNISALDQLMEWCENNYSSYNTYKNRRNNTRAFVVELESQGKLTSGGLTEEGFDLSTVNSLYCYPFKGSAQITCGYGAGTALGGQGYSGTKTHRGLDFGIGEGTQLYAATSGTIESFDMPDGSTAYSGNDSKWYGNFCVIHADDGNHILYCHMSETAGKSGRINKGEYIGLSGNTGNSSGAHLHFEVRNSISYGSDINPAPLLGIQNIKYSMVSFG